MFLFASRREGMPNVVLEAMASGLPCIVSRVGGAVDLVDHGKTGYLFDVDDEAGFADALSGLLCDAARAARMGSAARHHVVDHFALSKTAEDYRRLYSTLLGAARE